MVLNSILSIGDHKTKTGHNESIEYLSDSKTENTFDLLIHVSLLILRDHLPLNSQHYSFPFVLS